MVAIDRDRAAFSGNLDVIVLHVFKNLPVAEGVHCTDTCCLVYFGIRFSRQKAGELVPFG